MKIRALVISFILGLAAGHCAAQQHTPKPEAQAAFDEARKLPFGDAATLTLYRKAIDLDPDFAEAHQYYILSYSNGSIPRTGTDEEKKAAGDKKAEELRQLYEKWAAERPSAPVYPWALGILCEYRDPNRAVAYFKEAIALDPNYGPAYDMLAIGTEAQGDLKQSRAYAAKGHEVWPTDVTIWRHYLGAYTTQNNPADLEKAEGIALQLAEKYPKDGVSMLSYVAGRSTDPKHARAMYELILEKFPKEAANYSLTPLFNLDMAADPQAALQLAVTMRKGLAAGDSKSKEDDADAVKQWSALEDYAKAVVEGRRLIAEGKASAALTMLEQAKDPPRLVDARPLKLARTAALDATGQTEKAFNNLQQTFASTPSSAVYAAMLSYGRKIGKDKAQVDAGVSAARASIARAGMPFTLTDYATGKPVSLADYKGRVVLVNFWYPMCGPCRGEFPYIQMALDKYKDRGFAVLAINGHPPEDDWVMPLIRGWKLGFTPLKSTEPIIKTYNVKGFPANFLYGSDGRIYPMPSQVRPQTLEEFELQIEGLLAQANASPQKTPVAAAASPLPSAVDDCVVAAKMLQENPSAAQIAVRNCGLTGPGM
jgi:tetratricopeptide (TPR) repeat protein